MVGMWSAGHCSELWRHPLHEHWHSLIVGSGFISALWLPAVYFPHEMVEAGAMCYANVGLQVGRQCSGGKLSA
jgi:hypothetical protein